MRKKKDVERLVEKRKQAGFGYIHTEDLNTKTRHVLTRESFWNNLLIAQMTGFVKS
jgi:hypothetical protein